jgi:hypothetical protein
VGQPRTDGNLPIDHPCSSAIATAEQRFATPPGLLAAIGRVESGRQDPAGGVVHPWPWTVNAEGRSFFYNTKAEAVAAVQAMRSKGTRSIDVGCMQINLLYHPDAFAAIELAFDPQANTLYAARYLRELFARTSDWRKAAALYHSATLELGAAYQQKVMAVWPHRPITESVSLPTVARAWSATLAVASIGYWHSSSAPSPSVERANPYRTIAWANTPRAQ